MLLSVIIFSNQESEVIDEGEVFLDDASVKNIVESATALVNEIYTGDTATFNVLITIEYGGKQYKVLAKYKGMPDSFLKSLEAMSGTEMHRFNPVDVGPIYDALEVYFEYEDEEDISVLEYAMQRGEINYALLPDEVKSVELAKYFLSDVERDNEYNMKNLYSDIGVDDYDTLFKYCAHTGLWKCLSEFLKGYGNSFYGDLLGNVVNWVSTSKEEFRQHIKDGSLDKDVLEAFGFDDIKPVELAKENGNDEYGIAE